MAKKYDKDKYKPKPYESTKLCGEQYYRLFDSLITSKAYMSISNDAKTLYTYMLREAHKDKQYYQTGEFKFSLTLCQKYLNVKRPKSIKTINELITYGFIERVNNSKYTKQTSKFIFSDKWKLIT